MLTNQSVDLKICTYFYPHSFIAFPKPDWKTTIWFEIATVVEDNGFDGETFDLSTNFFHSKTQVFNLI